MRKLAWLTLVAAAALFFSAPESAFAHGAHHHATHAQSHSQPAPAASIEHALVSEESHHDAAFVSARAPEQQKCPHGQGTGCGFCCACAGGASVALATPEMPGRALRALREHDWRSPPHEIRQAILDLSRPPKSFA